ncbi:ATP-dependent dna helicase [Fusarium longipes]|uniref:ATP-dependent dna helicase n=1 Tax=Fusarium longipes TaxID=694270 RepID=A0A395T5U2_9HYPO|nr:ATP-dependent dna helicase [Fusarium longipes]
MSSKRKERMTLTDPKPIQVPLSAKWDIRVPGPEMIKLIYGFCPRDMDDRWVCYTDGPDKEGNIRVRICRSWTRMERVALIGQVPAEAYKNEKAILREGGVISEIIWEKPGKNEHDPMDEKGAKEFVVGFSKALMDCNLKR